MNKSGFCKRFKIGKKYTWDKKSWIKILYIGERSFFYIEDEGAERNEDFDFMRHAIPYKEPDMAWDWEAEEQWGTIDDNTHRIVKIGKDLYAFIFKEKRRYHYLKSEIIEMFTCCNPPENQEDYR